MASVCICSNGMQWEPHKAVTTAIHIQPLLNSHLCNSRNNCKKMSNSFCSSVVFGCANVVGFAKKDYSLARLVQNNVVCANFKSLPGIQSYLPRQKCAQGLQLHRGCSLGQEPANVDICSKTDNKHTSFQHIFHMGSDAGYLI